MAFHDLPKVEIFVCAVFKWKAVVTRVVIARDKLNYSYEIDELAFVVNIISSKTVSLDR